MYLTTKHVFENFGGQFPGCTPPGAGLVISISVHCYRHPSLAIIFAQTHTNILSLILSIFT